MTMISPDMNPLIVPDRIERLDTKPDFRAADRRFIVCVIILSISLGSIVGGVLYTIQSRCEERGGIFVYRVGCVDPVAWRALLK